ncbi:hypothetical protein LguiA_020264 [Lonicera macranthoides]
MDPTQRTPKYEILNGLVPSRGTSWEAPSSEPHVMLHFEVRGFIPFVHQNDVERHVNEFHDNDDDSPASDIEGQKQYVCPEIGCEKVFKYASKLRKHEDSHVIGIIVLKPIVKLVTLAIKLDTVEVFCSKPGYMKYFTNEQYLRDHLQSCHQHITCEICGTKQLKRNIKRHPRTHEPRPSVETEKHIKAVHFEQKPFSCSIPGCGMRFSFKHEKSGCHLFTQGDFEESDEQFCSRPRGGCKRTCPAIDTLVRKRVVLPTQSDSILNEGPDYLSWLLSGGAEDQH